MARSLTSALWSLLLSKTPRPVEVYEIDPIDRLGAVQNLPTGTMEGWATSTSLTGWTMYPNGGTISQDGTNQRSGTYCAAFNNPGATTLAIERYDLHFVPGAFYQLEGYIKASIAKTGGFALRFVNLTNVAELNSNGAWTAGNTGLLCLQGNPNSAGYQRVSLWFQAPTSVGGVATSATDSYAISLQQYNGTTGWTSGQLLYMDDFSIMGPYERPTLYFSDQAVSWNGNTYTALAVQRGPINEQLEFKVPDCSIKLSNVSNLMQKYLTPVDMLDRARARIRLLFRDPSNVLSADSMVRFEGRLEPVKRATETEFPLTLVGLADGMGTSAPGYSMYLTCGWQFANGFKFDGNGHCSYQQSTTLAATVSGSTTILLTAAGNFANGDSIQVGGAAATTIVSGGGTTTLVVSTPQNCVSGGGVRYADCPGRSNAECVNRGMNHRFGGFPGISITSRMDRTLPMPTDAAFSKTRRMSKARIPQKPTAAKQSARPILYNFTQQEGGLGSPGDPVPILYGRRRVRPIITEVITSLSPVTAQVQPTAFCVISVGPIAAIVRAYVNGMLLGEVIIGGEKVAGTYQRLGGPGVTGNETIAAYVSDPTTLARAQNVDYRSFAGMTYSEMAYLIMLRGFTLDVMPDIALETRGLKIQAYTSLGAVSGALKNIFNPLWQSVDFFTKDYGLNNLLSDVDFGVTQPESAYADVVINSTEANTTVTQNAGSPTTQCIVGNTEGFINGRAILVNGVANTVDYVDSPTRMYLGTAVAQSIGQVVVQRPNRFESHINIAQADKATNWLKALLDSCAGYITEDNGKVQFRIERDTCKDCVSDGPIDLWSSSTVPTNWNPVISSLCTVTQETSIVHTPGGSSAKLNRADSGNLWLYQTLPRQLEPGRWYRIEVWTYATGLGKRTRIEFRNTTRNLDVSPDGLTWGTPTVYAIDDSTTRNAWGMHELTFRVPETFAAADTYIAFILGGNVGDLVYYDDFKLRGPYAGDFREFPTSLVMGMKDESFDWSLDKRDRETNQVTGRFLNESAQFGDDTFVANDFNHQRIYPVKTLPLDLPAVCDRDQAARLTQRALAKRRTLGPGCAFVGSPAALACQPGDVILVSHTVPGWSRQEQRVSSVSVLGLGDPDEHFVKIETEDYQESIYTDFAPIAVKSQPRLAVNITPTVNKNSGGILDLSWSVDATLAAIQGFTVHSSDTSGFSPDDSNRIFRTTGTRMVYTCPQAYLEQTRYYRVVALTDYGPLQSPEIPVAIYAVDYGATDGTQTEGESDGNLIYDSDYHGQEFQDGLSDGPPYPNGTKNGDGWHTNSNVTYTGRAPNTPVSPSGTYHTGSGSDVAFTSLANAIDGNATSYAVGTASGPAGNVASMKFTFPAATRTGRGRIQGKLNVGVQNGTVLLRFSTDGGTTWSTIALATSNSDVTYYTPRLVAQVMANFIMEIIVTAKVGTAGTVTFNAGEGAFDEEVSSASVISHIVPGVSSGRWEGKGDGTNYAEIRRRFPDKSPTGVTSVFTGGTPNRWEIKLQRLTPGAALTNPVEIRIEDTASGQAWTVASIAGADVLDSWLAYTDAFVPIPSPLSGVLDIVIRTKDANGVRQAQSYLGNQRVIKRYQTSASDQVQGRFPDRSIGEAIGWPKGKLTGTGYKKVALS